MDLGKAKSLGIAYTKRNRVGRGPGSGNGKTAGRGFNGQKSRSGYKQKLGFEGGQMPLYRRIPRRGFNNARFTVRFTIINVGDLNGFDAGTVVDLDKVLEVGLTSPETPWLKVLGNGEIDRPLTIKTHKISASAKAKVEAAGGTIEILPLERPKASKADASKGK